ncbi:hypothetical protein ACFL15_02655 [Patescibacteria group bacterium]
MVNFWKDREILVSITTLGGNWEEKVDEIKNLGLEKVALFLTGLEYRNINKKDLFKKIEDTKVKEIPFVHITNFTKPEDLDYLINRFKTKAFNIHSEDKYPLKHDLSRYKHMIYIENVFRYTPKEQEIKNFAGTCIDLTHLEISKKRYPKIYEKTIDVLDKFNCGCNHISSYKKVSVEDARYIKKSSHFFTKLSQFNYLKSYPARYFSKIIALELENSIKDQLKAKEYIKKLLKDKK